MSIVPGIVNVAGKRTVKVPVLTKGTVLQWEIDDNKGKQMNWKNGDCGKPYVYNK